MAWYSSTTITDLAGNVHSVTPSMVGSGGVLKISLALDEADTFNLLIEDHDGTVRAWLEQGCIVDICVGTAATPTFKIFHGMVEEIKESMPNPSAVQLEITGRDLFSIYLEQRITETYLATEVSAIVRDLVNTYIPYPSDTVIAMSFYEGTGTVAHDESANGNDGTISGASWTASGKYGSALTFDGDNDYVDLTTDLSPTSMTLSLWFKITTLASEHAHELHLTDTLYFASANDYICIEGTSDYFAVAPTAAAWHHLVFTYSDKTDDADADLWIDGTKYDITLGGGAHDIDDLQNIGMAANAFDGQIDEIRAWDRVLTSQEIKDLYNFQYLHDIDATTATPDDIRFPYRRLVECLDDMAKLSGFTYRGTPNNCIVFEQEGIVDSGIDYDSTDITPGLEKTTSVLPIRNRVYVIGGDYMQDDQVQDTVGATAENSKDYYYAGSFTPTRAQLDQVSLYLKRTGSPDDLTGAIWTDSSGPSSKVATFTVDTDFVGTSGAWVPITISATLLIGEKYWISIDKTGDAGNCYEWYDDDGAAGENAYDADGAGAWTVQGSSYAMCLKTYYAVPVIARKQDYASGGNYLWRDEVHQDAAITSRAVANDMASGMLEALKDETPSLSVLTTFNQTAIPNRGELVSVDIDQYSLDDDYACKTVSFTFQAGRINTPFMDVELGKSKDDLSEWLSDVRRDLDRLKIGDTGVSGGLVNSLVSAGATATVSTGSCTLTEVASGDFEIDSAEIDFSDIG